MSTTLYRKYRPQLWKEMTNQNHVKITLQNEIETDKVAHAYLFCGPRGIGKTTAARLLAKAVNCERRKASESEPCNKCNSCEEITSGRDLDIVEIDAASHTGVDNVRENIVTNAKFSPSRRKYKVFIIDEVHMLSTSAFNALLKTIEEPPPRVIFIMATTEVHKIPATIISRCQRFDFKKISRREVVERLKYVLSMERVEVDESILESIARSSEGCVRDAESLLGQVLALRDAKNKISREQAELVISKSDFNLVGEFVGYLATRDAEKALRLVNKLVEEGIDLSQFTTDLVEFLRKILLASVSGSLKEFSFDLDEDSEKKIIQLAKEIDPRRIIGWLELFIEKKQELKFSDIAQLPLEMAVVEIVGGSSAAKEMSPPPTKPSGGGNFSEEHPKIPDPVLPASLGEKSEPFSRSLSSAIKPLPKKEEKDRVEAVAPASGVNKTDLTLEQIKEKWFDIVRLAADRSASLVFILRVGQPMAVQNGTLQIGFKYRFHKERINESKNNLILRNLIKEATGGDVRVAGVVADLPEPESPPTVEVNKVLEEFGGKIIE
jgi:DNA polymerase-3 subunit gamma/tau